MEQKAFHDNHFDSIQALRGIAAIFVILEHVRFLNCGAFGVDIFFCISGFMIMFTTQKNTRFFLRKRIIRIVPLYYIMTIGTYLLLLLMPGMFEQTKADPVFLAKSLLFVPFDVGNGILQPIMRIGWTVNCEMFFYLIFLIALHISHKYRGIICGTVLLGIVCLAHLLPFSFAPLTFYGDPVMLEFALGILCYYLAKWLYSLYAMGKLPTLLTPICLFASLIIFFLLVYTKSNINILGFRRFLFWGIPGMILVLCFFTFGLYLKMPKFSIVLGNMSFSIYLIHYYPVMFLDRVVFDFSVCTPFSLFGVLVATALCLLSSWICYLIIEKKVTEWLKKKVM